MPYKNPEAAKAAKRRYYEKNIDKVKAAARKQHENNRRVVCEIKESTPCADCGINYPSYVMQFDHIGSDKVGDVSALLRSASLATVLAEIDKCEVVCANCHAIRSWTRATSS